LYFSEKTFDLAKTSLLVIFSADEETLPTLEAKSEKKFFSAIKITLFECNQNKTNSAFVTVQV
jgi:hypothetical protein